MPRRQTSDAIHVAMTDHRIAVPLATPSKVLVEEQESELPLRPKLSFPYSLAPAERSYYLGLALRMKSSTRAEGLALLRRSGIPAPPMDSDPGAKLLAAAKAALLAGRRPEAVRYWKRALEYASAAADARSNLGLAALEAGTAAEARGHLEAALALSPDHPEALNNYARLLAAEGKMDEALLALDAALAADPNYAEAKENRRRIEAFLRSR